MDIESEVELEGLCEALLEELGDKLMLKEGDKDTEELGLGEALGLLEIESDTELLGLGDADGLLLIDDDGERLGDKETDTLGLGERLKDTLLDGD